ncbi:skin secretory protein xP2-like [Elephas maximus indicus]|uniref:skin secretory protein xP2-like n=1 Tax=Elephas maximus indicus TaxID=99487 RepID=UPI002116F953|nr:skin secretory protein xP2-like [Elephas maximus indicus]
MICHPAGVWLSWSPGLLRGGAEGAGPGPGDEVRRRPRREASSPSARTGTRTHYGAAAPGPRRGSGVTPPELGLGRQLWPGAGWQLLWLRAGERAPHSKTIGERASPPPKMLSWPRRRVLRAELGTGSLASGLDGAPALCSNWAGPAARRDFSWVARDPGEVWGSRVVLPRPGRGPQRPRAEEAGKEARRRERGMIHPEKPELETPQPGNSLAGSTGEPGGEPARRGPSPSIRSPCLLPWPQSGLWGKRVSSARTSALTEEVWKECAGRVRLESVTPPPSHAAVCEAQAVGDGGGEEVGAARDPCGLGRSECPLTSLLRCSHVRGRGQIPAVLTLETPLPGTTPAEARDPRASEGGAGGRNPAAGDAPGSGLRAPRLPPARLLSARGPGQLGLLP